ncbi:MAG: hypothetical protein M1839_005101 [Geoglossum umbratile]|nr:MAG: hypothetical protein M1839_005101 [Geoglossum umbratile]
MGPLAVAQAALYYLYRFFSYLLYPLLLLLFPVFHLGRYTLRVALVPFHLLVKFETLYIFAGVAAVIGIITGSLLHLFSTVVVSALNLQPSSGGEEEEEEEEEEDDDDDEEYVKPRRKQQLQLRTKPSGVARSKEKSRRDGGGGGGAERAYVEMDWGTRRARAREPGGLLSQIILEEEDNSEDEF